MTTRDKGITFPGQYQYTDISTASGYKVTDTPGNYAVKNAWYYGTGIISPIILTNPDLTSPVNFSLISQNDNPSFANIGGVINLTPGVGSIGNASGNIIIKDTAGNGGGWNTSHIELGVYHLWVDTSKRLRIKNSVPTSDTDGNVVSYDYTASAIYDPPSLADGAGTTTTIVVANAVLGDFAIASFSLDLQGIVLTAYVSAANTVSIRFQNESGGVVDLASGTLSVKVIKK